MMTERERQILRWIESNPLISQQELAQKAGITRSSVAVHISNLMKKGLIRGKGYILQREPYAVVVGGANIDIGGKPFQPLIRRDSNPGRVTLSSGGVGRNIAANLAQLGVPVRFITALGDDAYAAQIVDGCRRAGMDLSASLTVPGGATSTYLYLTNEAGDMELAVNDMQIYEHLTPEFLNSKRDLFEKAALCVMDTNLTEEAVGWLAENIHCPIFCDPVSAAKAVKLSGRLGHLHTLKPNLLEAELLSGVSINNENSIEQAAEMLLKKGLKQVFLSLGAGGVYCADCDSRLHLPCVPSNSVNTTGVGDSFLAAAAWGWMRGLSLYECGKAGAAAASICIESPKTVSPDLNEKTLLDRMNGLEKAVMENLNSKHEKRSSLL
ncbi:MAG: PfkB family carbohydrate kinase [Oscillospiraceae bacterium]|jgi:pseudouridine kinase|nr:PfkB family carbohydrate kinase [Oscillospiraceae bacterium]